MVIKFNNLHGIHNLTVGVYLSLGRRFYRNNSVIPIIDVIGDGNLVLSDFALQCTTDRRPCCYHPSNRHGEWYFPDGKQIPNYNNAKASNLPFFRNRGDGGTVHLNRVRNSIMSPTGKFCCKVPDAIGVYQTLCAILSKALLMGLFTRQRL